MRTARDAEEPSDSRASLRAMLPVIGPLILAPNVPIGKGKASVGEDCDRQGDDCTPGEQIGRPAAQRHDVPPGSSHAEREGERPSRELVDRDQLDRPRRRRTVGQGLEEPGAECQHLPCDRQRSSSDEAEQGMAEVGAGDEQEGEIEADDDRDHPQGAVDPEADRHRWVEQPGGHLQGAEMRADRGERRSADTRRGQRER